MEYLFQCYRGGRDVVDCRGQVTNIWDIRAGAIDNQRDLVKVRKTCNIMVRKKNDYAGI